MRVLSPGQKILVRETFASLTPSAAYVAALLYARLFEIAPHLRDLFHVNMNAQGDKLLQSIAVAIDNLDDLDSITPAIQALGRRHAGYGVTAADFETVRDALLWTLDRCLGPKFTNDVRRAWATTYDILSQIMLDALAAALT